MSERQNRRKKADRIRAKERKRQARAKAERAKRDYLPNIQANSPQKNNAHEQTAEPKSNDKPVADKDCQVARTQNKGRRSMETVAILFGTLGGILAIVCTVLLAIVHFRDTGLWFGCAAIVAFTISGFAYLQNHLWKEDETNRPIAAQPSSEGEWIVSGDGSPLTPGSGPSPIPGIKPLIDMSRKFKIADSDIVFVMNSTFAWTDKFPHTFIAQGQSKEPMFVIYKENKGVFVSAKICDRGGNLVCELVKNQLRYKAPKIFQLTQTPHKLAVRDNDGNKLLDVEFANPRTINIFGDYYLRHGGRVATHGPQMIIGDKEQGVIVPGYTSRFVGKNEFSFHVDPDAR